MPTARTSTRPERRKAARPANVPKDVLNSASLKREMSTWLDNRTVWNHDDWMGLLSDLRTKGYSDLIDTPRGQETIGLYLESNRKNPAC